MVASAEREQLGNREIGSDTYSASHEGVQSIVDSAVDRLVFATEILSTVGPEGLYDFRGQGEAEIHADELRGHVEATCRILDAVVPRVDGSWIDEIEERATTISGQEHTDQTD